MAREKPQIEFFDPKGDIASKFDFYIKIVIGILLVAMLMMFLMVSGLLLEAWHFNSATYKEYSSKINTLEEIQKSNEILLETNKQNQQIIIEQQKQIQELLKKR